MRRAACSTRRNWRGCCEASGFAQPQRDDDGDPLDLEDARADGAVTQRSVSVVICTDSRLPYLKTTLRALRHLDYAAFEVVVVCGPTQDGARGFVEAFEPRLKIAHCPERNISRARNLGIALAAGEIVAFLDDDADAGAGMARRLDRGLRRSRDAAAGGVVYDETGLTFQARYVTVDRLRLFILAIGRSRRRSSAFRSRRKFPHLLGANCSFRREVLIELGGFDEEYEYFLDETDLVAPRQRFRRPHRAIAPGRRASQVRPERDARRNVSRRQRLAPAHQEPRLFRHAQRAHRVHALGRVARRARRRRRNGERDGRGPSRRRRTRPPGNSRVSGARRKPASPPASPPRASLSAS